MGRSARAHRGGRRGPAGAARRVLDPGCGHPPPHVRGGRPLGPGRPRGLGRHPSGQGAQRSVRRPRGPLAAPGRGRRPPTRARARARRGPGAQGGARRAPFRRRAVAHSARRGAAARRRGGLRCGSPRRRQRLCHRTPRRPVGGTGAGRGGRAAPATPHGRSREPSPAPPRAPPGRPRRPCGVAGRRPRRRCLPGPVGPGPRHRAARRRPRAWPRCRLRNWPITSAPSGRWPRPGSGSDGASR